MTSPANINRQTVLSADVEVTFADFTSGVALPIIYLRPGTRIQRGWVDIETAWNATGNVTYTIGDTEGVTDDVDRWLTSTDAKTAALTALLAPLKASTLGGTEALTMTVTTASGTNSAGKARVHIEYTEESRTTEIAAYLG
jgi:hypothetical protein